MPSVRHWGMRRISPASHPKNTSRFWNAQGHTPATLACLPRHKLLSDRIERQQKLLPPQLISTSNPVFFSPTLRMFSLNAVFATLESCQLLKYYLASNYLYLALYSKCADLKNTPVFSIRMLSYCRQPVSRLLSWNPVQPEVVHYSPNTLNIQ